jgi:N utilization substance protein A
LASIYQSIEILSKEKGIDAQIVVDAVKDAILVAARKQFRGNEELVADFDMVSGALLLFAVKVVVEAVVDPVREMTLEEARKTDPAAELGSLIRFPRPTDVLGRIAAQTARQVILQKVREAERENIFAEYSGRVGELVNTSVKRVEGMDLVVDLGKTEARLPKKEQSRLENFTVGDRVRCVIKSVDKTGKNAGVLVSRAAPELVMRLFEQEVPEIYDSTVIIRACAREAGERTKIAVLSKDRDVDCVGACVGMKGMRVQSIIRELRGEKIDIIEYNEDIQRFVEKALSPARISRVAIVDTEARHMEVIVEDSQLSLAIGKKGQNVRLAAKLIGWRVDIKTEEEKRQEVAAAMVQLGTGTPLSALLDHGLDEEIYNSLITAGFGTVEKISSMTPEDLEVIPGISPDSVAHLGLAVNTFYGQPPAEAGSSEEQAEQEPGTDAEPTGIAEPDAAAAPDEAAPEAAEAAPVALDAAGSEDASVVDIATEEVAVEDAPADEAAEAVSTAEELQENIVDESAPADAAPESSTAPSGTDAAIAAAVESDTIENSGLPLAGSTEN